MAVNGIEIEVGQKWVTRGDMVATITHSGRRAYQKHHFVGHVGQEPCAWKDDGSVLGDRGKHAFDLVKPEGLWHRRPDTSANLVSPDISSAVREADSLRIRLFTDPSTYEAAVKDLMDQIKGAGVTPQRRDTDKKDTSGGGKLTGNHYYRVDVKTPISDEVAPYAAECADIIEALNMTFNEGEAFKALWRLAAARLGKTKAGGNPVYDADKAAHYGARTAAQTRAQQAVTK